MRKKELTIIKNNQKEELNNLNNSFKNLTEDEMDNYFGSFNEYCLDKININGLPLLDLNFILKSIDVNKLEKENPKFSDIKNNVSLPNLTEFTEKLREYSILNTNSISEFDIKSRVGNYNVIFLDNIYFKSLLNLESFNMKKWDNNIYKNIMIELTLDKYEKK